MKKMKTKTTRNEENDFFSLVENPCSSHCKINQYTELSGRSMGRIIEKYKFPHIS